MLSFSNISWGQNKNCRKKMAKGNCDVFYIPVFGKCISSINHTVSCELYRSG